MSPAHRHRSGPWRYVSLVLLVTGTVAVLPVLLIWQLRAGGTIGSGWVALVAAALLSLALSLAVRALWARSPHENDLLYSELLLWGWFSRWQSKRRLENAVRLLGIFEADTGQTIDLARRAQLMRRLADSLDAQDAYLDGHSRRVARHAEKIGKRMGLSCDELAKLRAAAAIHDVGKLHVPRQVLDKPGALTDAEFAMIRRHSEEGAMMVDALGDPDLTAIVRHHHERIDGRGYPDGLAGDQIPLGARIVAVADTFDAITSPRPYRGAARHRVAIETLRKAAGTQLDPAAVKAFLSYYSGRRHLLLTAALVEMPQQAVARAVGFGSSVGAISSSSALATLTATAMIGAAAAAVPAHTSGVRSAEHPRNAALFRSAESSSALAALTSGLPAQSAGVGAGGGFGHASHVVRRASHAPRAATLRAPGHAPARVLSSTTSAPSSAPAATTTSGTAGGHRYGSSSGISHRHSTLPPGRVRATGRPHRTAAAHPKHWTPPGHTGQPPPGRIPAGPPGSTGATPGLSVAAPPGLRGQTPPGNAK